MQGSVIGRHQADFELVPVEVADQVPDYRRDAASLTRGDYLQYAYLIHFADALSLRARRTRKSCSPDTHKTVTASSQ